MDKHVNSTKQMPGKTSSKGHAPDIVAKVEVELDKLVNANLILEV